MKKLLTLALLAMGATTLTAQTLPSNLKSYSKDENAKNFKKHVRHMLGVQQKQAAYKTSGQDERVIAESSYEYNSSPNANIYDSTHYIYSGNNGSKFDFGYMDYNAYFAPGFEALDYPYEWSMLKVMADTVQYWYKDSATAPLVLNEITTATFNPDKKLASYKDHYYDLGILDGFESYYFTYNGQGKTTQIIGLEDYGSGLDSILKINFYYDAQSRLLKDSVFDYDNGQWELSGVINYTYDPAGNVSSIGMEGMMMGIWIPIFKYENTFYPDQKLKTSISYNFDGTNLSMTRKDTLAYANNSSFPTLHAEYSMNNNLWEPSFQRIKHLNAQGLPDTVYSYMNDMSNNWTLSGFATYTYTSYGNPIQGRMYSVNGSFLDLSTVENYYYDLYLGVKNIAAQEQMTVYPNPATNEINVSWSKGAGKKVTLELINAAGQKAYGASLTWKENQSVSIQNLAPGMYFLMVRNEAGAVIFKEAVVKQ